MKIHAGHVEVAVARLLNYRVYTIVPNVSWGLGLAHECDMLCLDRKNRFTEIEIKISASDLRRDFTKSHSHKSKLISRLVYAMPEALYRKHSGLVPDSCGIVTVAVEQHSRKIKARWQRLGRHRKDIAAVPDHVLTKFMALGCMRIWSLKEANYNLQQRLKTPTT